jgi:hypothetical protein
MKPMTEERKVEIKKVEIDAHRPRRKRFRSKRPIKILESEFYGLNLVSLVRSFFSSKIDHLHIEVLNESGCNSGLKKSRI